MSRSSQQRQQQPRLPRGFEHITTTSMEQSSTHQSPAQVRSVTTPRFLPALFEGQPSMFLERASISTSCSSSKANTAGVDSFAASPPVSSIKSFTNSRNSVTTTSSTTTHLPHQQHSYQNSPFQTRTSLSINTTPSRPRRILTTSLKTAAPFSGHSNKNGGNNDSHEQTNSDYICHDNGHRSSTLLNATRFSSWKHSHGLSRPRIRFDSAVTSWGKRSTTSSASEQSTTTSTDASLPTLCQNCGGRFSLDGFEPPEEECCWCSSSSCSSGPKERRTDKTSPEAAEAVGDDGREFVTIDDSIVVQKSHVAVYEINPRWGSMFLATTGGSSALLVVSYVQNITARIYSFARMATKAMATGVAHQW
ncbi:MAG: hypothetical protein J3Q66DRAFT_374201 [Benniella sp.]|nr:MAG: hypothetical protein J3Q66DRAFT_374201 [Benniella sp.]